MATVELTEDCCFNSPADNCKGDGCPCGCHAAQPAQIDTLVAERDKAQALAASMSEDWHRMQKKTQRLQTLLMDAAAEVHRFRRHEPYGSSFLDCDLGPCERYRAALD